MNLSYLKLQTTRKFNAGTGSTRPSNAAINRQAFHQEVDEEFDVEEDALADADEVDVADANEAVEELEEEDYLEDDVPASDDDHLPDNNLWIVLFPDTITIVN